MTTITPITSLPAASSVAATDILPLVQTATTRRATVAQLHTNAVMGGTFNAGGTVFQVAATNTATSRNGFVQLVDGTWAPSSTTGQYYNRYFSIELTSGLSPRGTVSQLWNTQNVIMSRAVSTSASMANSHTIMDLAYATIPAGVGVGDGGVLDGGGLPVNPYYQEIGGYAYNAIILTAGHYNEGIASYFYDYTGVGAGVEAKSSNFFSVIAKKAAGNTYSTYGFQAVSSGVQQTTYAPSAAFRADGGWQYGLDLSGAYNVAPIRIPYNTTIKTLYSDGSRDVALLAYAGGTIYLGGGTSDTAQVYLNTTAGTRFTNVTTAQKNAITPGAGTMLFDTTLGKMCIYTGAAWQTITSV